MIRKVRFLGTAFIAALALSAVGASAASAEGLFQVSVAPATVTATSPLGNDTFKTEAGTVECKSTFHAVQNTLTAESLTVDAEYKECKAFGFAATVDMMSCDYLFTTPETNVEHWKSKVHVQCETPGDAITISAGPCKSSVFPHTPSGHVDITNTPLEGDVDVQATFTEIPYTVTQDGFLCPFNGTGAKTGATYTQHKKVTLHSPTADVSVGH